MIKNYRNGNFIVFEGDILKLISGSMQVEDDKVLSFNEENLDFDQIVDLEGKLVTPVFCNLHLHLGEKFFKFKKKMPLLDYLDWTEKINKGLGQDKDKLWAISAHETIKENQKSGNYVLCTLRGGEILSKYNVKGYAGFPVMKSEKLKGFYLSGIEGYKNFCQDCYSRNVVPGVFLHSLYYTDKECIDYAKECHSISNTFIAVHVAEDRETEQRVFEKFGKGSLQILEENGLLNEKTALIHCCEYSERDLALIAKHNCTVVICPYSNVNLIQKPYDPRLLEKYKINWAVASDGLGSGHTADLLSQICLLCDLYNDLSLIELFKSISLYPCKFLGCTDELLGVGSKSNFNVFDVPQQDSLEDYLKLIIYNREILCYNSFSERSGL